MPIAPTYHPFSAVVIFLLFIFRSNHGLPSPSSLCHLQRHASIVCRISAGYPAWRVLSTFRVYVEAYRIPLVIYDRVRNV
ncbi:hypothetical protein GGR55DRAFT_635373, partial [Xylaria sp. FL0064]